jgi:hypothetical protein
VGARLFRGRYLVTALHATVLWLCKLHVTVFIKRDIIALSVSFIAEMMLCTLEIQTQLL